MTDFPDKVIGKHAYVVLNANLGIVPTLERGSILFDGSYFPGIHAQYALNKATSEVEWAYTTQRLFKVKSEHTKGDLNAARARILDRDEVPS